jgi:hypothetical protein
MKEIVAARFWNHHTPHRITGDASIDLVHRRFIGQWGVPV